FSLVNRRFGNDEANNIIKRYANALKAYADEGEMIGHLGGDNFVALIRKEKTSDFLKMIAEKGVLTYGEKNNFRTPLKIYATAGVLEIDETIRDVGPVMSMANNALVVAKNVLHKPYVFMSKELQEQSIRNKQISVRFADALRTGEFIVYYQSVVNTEDNTIAGAEVFSRWLYEGKLMEAKEYIHNLDTDDSICQLDYFVLEQVCKDINRLLEEGVKPVPVYVNFSLKHLDEPEVVKNILDLLEKYQTPKELVLIEMVETPDQGEHKRMDAFVRKAREYGIHLSIDDFGSGYSSMNLFREHSIDFLKIDKNFVKAGAETEIDRIMINNMVRLAGELFVTPIAEGIENKELYSFIRGIGCKYMQGYLFDRPMPIEAFVDKLRAGKGLVE
ncbi:MAG: GGDEF domain-containing phosphodiesterase, partial [Lachnospiraceae bacterium]|nr:GGDEF domain-containing phosphodiesterase [Lachnospiraceae bacterium]